MDSLMSLFSMMNMPCAEQVLLVPHPRVAAAARERGFVQVFEVPFAPARLINALVMLKPHLLSATAHPSNH